MAEGLVLMYYPTTVPLPLKLLTVLIPVLVRAVQRRPCRTSCISFFGGPKLNRPAYHPVQYGRCIGLPKSQDPLLTPRTAG